MSLYTLLHLILFKYTTIKIKWIDTEKQYIGNVKECLQLENVILDSKVIGSDIADDYLLIYCKE